MNCFLFHAMYDKNKAAEDNLDDETDVPQLIFAVPIYQKDKITGVLTGAECEIKGDTRTF